MKNTNARVAEQEGGTAMLSAYGSAGVDKIRQSGNRDSQISPDHLTRWIERLYRPRRIVPNLSPRVLTRSERQWKPAMLLGNRLYQGRGFGKNRFASMHFEEQGWGLGESKVAEAINGGDRSPIEKIRRPARSMP